MTPGLAPGSPLAQALGASRERYNAAFVQARYGRPQLDGQALTEHLCSVVAPVVEVVAAVRPDRVGAVVDVLYDVSLDLVGARLLGPGSLHPVISEGWARLLPHAIHHLAAHPRRVVAAVTNALHYQATTPRARAAGWLEQMCALDFPTLDDFLGCGQVLAWRAGLAHFRLGALQACARLSPSLGRQALGLPARGAVELPELLVRLGADPWLRPVDADRARLPDPGLEVVHRAGDFRGFGGPFRRPPEVVAVDDQLYVTDSHDTWLLSADTFGYTLHPTALPPGGTTRGGRYHLAREGTVTCESASRRFPELAEVSHYASTSWVLAARPEHSHRIILVARRPVS